MPRAIAIALCLFMMFAVAVVRADWVDDRIERLLPEAELVGDELFRNDSTETWGDWLARTVPISALTGTDRPFERSFALVIGVSEFGPERSSLPATASNPPRMRQLLVDQDFDLIITLSNERATKGRIVYLMQDFFPAIVGEKDRFLFYFSGHGVVQEGGEAGFMPLTASKNLYSRMLAMSDIQTWDNSLSRARQVLFLLDTCFSGLATVQGQADPRELAVDQLSGKGHHLLTAATSGEQTIASDLFSGSIFTDALINAASGAADSPIRWDADGDGTTEEIKDGVVSLYELLSSVRTQVAVAAATAGWGARITPQLTPLRPSEGEFFFVTQEQVREVAGRTDQPDVQGQGGLAAGRYGGRDERIFETLKDSELAADFEQFIETYPDSIYVPFARNRLAALLENATVLPQAETTAGAGPQAVEAALIPREEDRRIVQQALTAVGFDTGVVDGIFGANTRRAIVRWQQARGLPVTAYLDPAQYGRLLVEAEALPRPAPEPASGDTRLVGTGQPLLAPADRDPRFEPGDRFNDCVDCPEMVVVPAGSFMMGSPDGEEGRDADEGPPHRVTIAEPFAVGVYEVTRGQFAAFVEATGHDAGNRCYASKDDGTWDWLDGRNWRSPGFPQSEEHPVVCVNWDDATAYVKWLSETTREAYRLLSEAEWEYVARAGTQARRHWGEDLDDRDGCRFANAADEAAKEVFPGWTVMNCRDGFVYTAPVGTFGANAFGLRDVLGNAWEWVEDCYHDSYGIAGRPDDGSGWTSGDCGRRVLRGGSWNYNPRSLRSADRDWYGTVGRILNGGFRVARTLR